MSTINPYVAPRADLDIQPPAAYQEMKYWTSKGRIGRLRYIAYAMGGYLIFLAIILIVGGLGSRAQSMLGTAVLAVSVIPYFIFGIMLGIRRAHDMNWSGWTVLLLLIPLVSLIWLFKAGTVGENTYGLPPPPNTLGVKILAWLFPVIFAIGIAAAIAIPAYQQYAVRAKAAQTR